VIDGKDGHRAPGGDNLIAWMAVLARELAGDAPSPARLMLAEAAAFAHAEFWLMTLCTAHDFESSEHPLNFKRRFAAQRRMESALRTLAQIRASEERGRRRVVVELE
jgi:aminoglycoside phosphotransferase (APT) family kinase protein